jgi:hypothetical protein
VPGREHHAGARHPRVEHQQNLATLPIAVLVLVAISNQMGQLTPLVPEILRELNRIQPKTFRRIGA